MGTHWAEFLLFIIVCAQFYCLTACDHVGLADAVCVLARPGGAGPPVVALASRATACPVWCGRRGPASLALPAAPPDLRGTTARRLLRRHLDRNDRALHRLHPAGDPAATGRRELRARRVEPRQALQVDQRDRDHLGRRSSRSSSCCRPCPAGIPWQARASPGTTSTTRRSTIVGALLLFGGWWVLSAKNWFKGPVAHGHRGGARRGSRGDGEGGVRAAGGHRLA